MELKQVLSTKTLDDKALILAHSLGMNITCVDFIQIKGLDFNLSAFDAQSFDAVIFTSANGVEYFFENERGQTFLKGKKIFSLSEKTSSELLSHNARANCIKKNAEELANAITQSNGIKSVVHICGNRTLDTMQSLLSTAGINYTRLLVYETELKSAPLNKNFDAILFYSPSGVESFFAVNRPDVKTIFCCIGETTAGELNRQLENATVIIPVAPAPESMLKSVGEYFRNKQVTK